MMQTFHESFHFRGRILKTWTFPVSTILLLCKCCTTVATIRGESRPRSGVDPDPRSGVNPDPRSGVDPDPQSGVDPDSRSGADPDPPSGADPDPPSGVDPEICKGGCASVSRL